MQHKCNRKLMGKKREKNTLPTRLLKKKNSWRPEITHPSPQELNGRPLSPKRAKLYRCLCGRAIFAVQLFRERLSDKVHATTPKGNLGGFEFTAFQRNLKFASAKGKQQVSRRDSYNVRSSVLGISHITLRDFRVHIFSDNHSRNSGMSICL